METFKISRSGRVTDRNSEVDLGWVDRIDYPRSRNGEVWTELLWEARLPHELATVSPYSFPVFDTRAAAAAHLASQ